MTLNDILNKSGIQALSSKKTLNIFAPVVAFINADVLSP